MVKVLTSIAGFYGKVPAGLEAIVNAAGHLDLLGPCLEIGKASGKRPRLAKEFLDVKMTVGLQTNHFHSIDSDSLTALSIACLSRCTAFASGIFAIAVAIAFLAR